MPKIILENVTKKWGDFIAVDHLNMEIDDRGFVTLLGPSGCGKTTTLRMIAGLETPTSGRITIGDQVVYDSEKRINIPASKRDVGFLFQNYALWPHMTVYNNIAFGLQNLKWKKEEIDKRVEELLVMLKIETLAKRFPSELSGGQQQRVAIARTLAPRPQVLFMDEPLSNLDAKLRLEMRTELKRIHRETDSTFVYVTHDQLEAMTLATQVCLMKEGILQQYQPPLTVYSKPVNIFVADFVGNPTMNFVESEVRRISKKTVEVQIEHHKFHFEAKEEIIFPWEVEKLVEDVVVETKTEEKTEKTTKAKDKKEEVEVAEPVKTGPSKKVILGIRPEFIKIGTTGIPTIVTAALPGGMETTVKLGVPAEKIEVDEDGKLPEMLELTGVVFGIIDYEYEAKVLAEFAGEDIILFDKDTENAIGVGSLKMVNKSEQTEKKDSPTPSKKVTKTSKK